MAKVAIATRQPAHAGKSLGGHGVSLKVLEPASRMSLRARPAAVAALSKAIGVTLPEKPKSSAVKAGRTVLWLGPDEWLVIDEAGGDPIGDCASVKGLHSAVDVSHRNVGIAVIGPNAADTINAGCPQDLSLAAFPVGAASRTVLGKVEMVLLRTGEDAFRLECWRSFSDYVWGFLSEAARDG
ncbi:sarcosine oxidase subunit gamma [Aminobacter sp. NyZ550]|jgi:sarcosine oxidase subunit gamma|uniref:Sarcosine oxidase subunit gamma n=2 Tax=Aminobacter TaxID=31988 RepID=A0AAC8YMN1_AMIAI|nr:MULTISPECIES: sarcosine oxidase subunit gamma [Aminobacter]AMS40886.1 sarcosine oxidase subunit gamma [Aminobacter aminovorans]MBA8909019.1 sarcosine oxidase subunit gamma [Aminobacter ciceronei]MBA9022731.1 sarcosine oxidase subunit gamma [Aminobacter ciceronei]MBB3709297.1 sarcosine oxidase subunit gamma [Aminobacter aminovorans]MRX36571.1 sarcosine oxidase subunit gamma family protein [Aminobacter sp. MDW-2]